MNFHKMSSIKFMHLHLYKGGGGVCEQCIGVANVASVKNVFGLKAILGCLSRWLSTPGGATPLRNGYRQPVTAPGVLVNWQVLIG